MITKNKNDILFSEYYKQWITTYKQGAIRPITMNKYILTHQWLKKLVPTLKISEITRVELVSFQLKISLL